MNVCNDCDDRSLSRNAFWPVLCLQEWGLCRKVRELLRVHRHSIYWGPLRAGGEGITRQRCTINTISIMTVATSPQKGSLLPWSACDTTYQATHTHTHTHTHTQTHIHTHTYTQTHTPTHIHTNTHINTHTHKHAHANTHTRTKHTQTHKHAHKHTHTRTYTHICLV